MPLGITETSTRPPKASDEGIIGNHTGMNPAATVCWCAGVMGVIEPDVAPEAVLDCRSKRAASAAAGVPQEDDPKSFPKSPKSFPKSLPSVVLNAVEHVRESQKGSWCLHSWCFQERASGGGSNGSSNMSGSICGVAGASLLIGVLIPGAAIKGAHPSGVPSTIGPSAQRCWWKRLSCAFSQRSCASSCAMPLTSAGWAAWAAWAASGSRGAAPAAAWSGRGSARGLSAGARCELGVAPATSSVANRSTRSLCREEATSSSLSSSASSIAVGLTCSDCCHACRWSRHRSTACTRCFIFFRRMKVPSSFMKPRPLSSKLACQCCSRCAFSCDRRRPLAAPESPHSRAGSRSRRAEP
mmetsp:Transcript_45104/g.133533  ORF Transcript_45104/g.133533 Transcript_45104/m.133533 type:complete len:355 (+) Transcript_45104:409-1473(+)